MNAVPQLLDQRSVGHVHLRMERQGISILRDAGAAKCRVPRGSREAILINTSGGLAGGDTLGIVAEAGESAALTLTSQAAERVYRTLGPPAEVTVSLTAGQGAYLAWLPQETILFEGSALNRRLNVDLASDATFIAVESLAFGRQEMGELVSHLSLSDQWRVRQGGRLVHAESFLVGPQWPEQEACFGDSRAMATVLLVSKSAETTIDAVRKCLGPFDGASAWNGKLVARLLARDAFTLRKALIPVLRCCVGADALPKCWSF